MRSFERLAHSVWECKYHIVWCSKYRYRVLKGDVGVGVRDIIRQLCGWKGIEIISGNLQADHVHLILSIPPKVSVSTAVGYLKGRSAIKIFDRFPRLRQRYWGKHFWARGYCVSTVGVDEEQLKKYVRWQLQKDRGEDQIQMW
jgi:putative transposase